MRKPPGWKVCTLLLVVAAHLWLGWTLANYRPDGRLAATRARAQAPADEVVMVLEFPARVAPARTASAQARRPLRRLPSASAAPASELALGFGAATAPARDEPGRPLDLRPSLPKTEFARTGPLERRPALAYESTRYDGAWIPTGNLEHVMARRSRIAGAILGALGALREPCTEKDRANYKRECVPDAYEYKPGSE